VTSSAGQLALDLEPAAAVASLEAWLRQYVEGHRREVGNLEAVLVLARPSIPAAEVELREAVAALGDRRVRVA
jgi:hypothetical protein